MTSSRHLVDGKYSIRDLVDLKELRQIFQNFTDSIGFTIGFLSVPDLKPLIKTGWRDICTRYHRMCPLAIERCRRSNARLARHLTRPGQVTIEKCGNGLVDCATPIIVKGKYIAILATGQVLLKPPNLERFRKQARLFGVPEEKYLAALKEIPVVSSRRLKTVTRFLSKLALVVVKLGYASLEEKERAEILRHEIVKRKSAENALREASNQMRAINENLADGMVYQIESSLDGRKRRFFFISPAVKRFHGLTAVEVLRDPRGIYGQVAREDRPLLRRRELLAARTRVPLEVDLRICLPSGDVRWRRFRSSPRLSPSGKTLLWDGIEIDITNRKKMRHDLEASEIRFRRLFESAKDGILLLDANTGRIEDINSSLVKTLGCSHKEMLGKELWEVGIFKDIAKCKAVFRELKKKKYVRYENMSLQTSNGKFVECEFLGSIYRADSKKIMQCNIRNITERKRMEGELKEVKERLEHILDATRTTVDIIDSRYNLRYVDPGWQKMHGDFRGRKCYEYFMGRMKPCPGCGIPRALKTHQITVTEESLLKEGGRKIEVHTIPYRTPTGEWLVAEFNIDINRRKQAEEELKERERKFQAIFSSAFQFIALLKPDGTVLEINETALRFAGVSLQRVRGKFFWEGPWWVLGKNIQKQLQDSIARAARGHFVRYPVRVAGKRKQTIMIDFSLTPVRDESGKVVLMIFEGRDISELKKVEEALKNNVEQMQLQFKRMPIGCILWDEKFCVQSWNPAAEKIFNYSPEEAIGKSAYELIVPDHARSHIEKLWKRLLKGDQTAHSKNENVTKDGCLILCKWTNTPIYHEHGAMMGVLSMVEDVTELKKAEDRIQDERRQLRQIIDAVPHLISINDRQGRLLLANRATADFYGLPPEKIVGRNLRDIHQPKDEIQSAMKDDAEVFDSERMKIIMGQMMTDSRGRLHVMHNIKMPFRLAGSNELAVLGVSVDITEQKKIEEFRNDILKTVSHELRTPLSIEREGISLVLDGTVGPLADQQTMILRTVLRNIDRLSRMIDNLLDVSRIESGKIELCQKPVFLENLIKEVVAEFQPKVAGKNLTIVTDLVDETLQERVTADPDKIQQVLTNLLDNAIRFSGQGNITVRTRLLASEVECEVADQGIGIVPENITRMFEKFQQFGRVAGAGEKGLGLGLAIVKGIIDLHRGRIWVKSHSGKGTSIFFTLPKVRERLP